jgi:hypothetical protein
MAAIGCLEAGPLNMPKPAILTTTVGSYPIPDWLIALPSEQARLDATRVVFAIQRNAGIDLPTDGELYRFDINHPETNGMIDYFLRPMAGIRSSPGRSADQAFRERSWMQFRRKPAGVVEGPIGEGSLGPAINHPTYFLQSSFFPGGRAMFFTSYRTGSPQLFEISLESGETRQLTSGAPIHPYSAALHPGGDVIVVTRSGGLWAIDRRTLAERCIVERKGSELGSALSAPTASGSLPHLKRAHAAAYQLGATMAQAGARSRSPAP